jgi:hypothetical protein
MWVSGLGPPARPDATALLTTRPCEAGIVDDDLLTGAHADTSGST